jgi:transcriptional regulator with XRE-family HTH domain
MAPHEKLIGFREAKGLSQSKFAVQLGVTPSTLNRIEAGTQIPQIKVAARIAKLTSGSPSVEDWAIASESQGAA